MYAYQGPRPAPATWDDDSRRDVVWDEEDNEDDDEFDPMGLERNHYITNTAPSRPARPRRPRRARKRREQSVESTHSTGTTGHFITSSQAASPGNTTGFVELSEEMEQRVARALDPTLSPPSEHPSPRSTPRTNPLLQDSDAYALHYQEAIPTPEEAPKRWRLPSFQSLLQSVGEFAILQPRSAPTYHHEDTRVTRMSTPGPPGHYSRHNLTQRHSFAASESSFNSGYVSDTTVVSSWGSTRKPLQRASSSDTEVTSRTLVGQRYERHTSEPPPPMYPRSMDRRTSLPHVFDPLSQNQPPAIPPQVPWRHPLPQPPRPYSAPPVSNAPIVDLPRGQGNCDNLHSQHEAERYLPRPQPEDAPYSPRSPAYSPTGYDQVLASRLEREGEERQRQPRQRRMWSETESAQLQTSSSIQEEYLTTRPPQYNRASSIGSVGYTTSAESPPGTPVKLYSKLPK